MFNIKIILTIKIEQYNKMIYKTLKFFFNCRLVFGLCRLIFVSKISTFF